MNEPKNPFSSIPNGYRLADQPQDCLKADVKFWHTIKQYWEPRHSNYHGVTFQSHIIYIVPILDIPEGYRLAKPEEYTRKDVMIWLSDQEKFIPRIKAYIGREFELETTYIVPIDLPTYSPPGKEKTPMQRKLVPAEYQNAINAKKQSENLITFIKQYSKECYAKMLEVDQQIAQMICHQTNDGKEWIEQEPEIPEGYRLAEPHEWKREDVKFWWIDQQKWEPRSFPGTKFDDPKEKTIYIVPIPKPLTDEDACVYPRKLVMVRHKDNQPWLGPYSYIGKVNGLYYTGSENQSASGWYQCREATQTEIEANSK